MGQYYIIVKLIILFSKRHKQKNGTQNKCDQISQLVFIREVYGI
jgi:hypothetical protein